MTLPSFVSTTGVLASFCSRACAGDGNPDGVSPWCLLKPPPTGPAYFKVLLFVCFGADCPFSNEWVFPLQSWVKCFCEVHEAVVCCLLSARSRSCLLKAMCWFDGADQFGAAWLQSYVGSQANPGWKGPQGVLVQPPTWSRASCGSAQDFILLAFENLQQWRSHSLMASAPMVNSPHGEKVSLTLSLNLVLPITPIFSHALPSCSWKSWALAP